MLQDKRKDLDSERQKKLLRGMVEELSKQDPDLYYRSTADIAAMLHGFIAKGGRLELEDRALMKKLSARDIEVLLSLH